MLMLGGYWILGEMDSNSYQTQRLVNRGDGKAGLPFSPWLLVPWHSASALATNNARKIRTLGLARGVRY